MEPVRKPTPEDLAATRWEGWREEVPRNPGLDAYRPAGKAWVVSLAVPGDAHFAPAVSVQTRGACGAIVLMPERIARTSLDLMLCEACKKVLTRPETPYP